MASDGRGVSPAVATVGAPRMKPFGAGAFFFSACVAAADRPPLEVARGRGRLGSGARSPGSRGGEVRCATSRHEPQAVFG